MSFSDPWWELFLLFLVLTLIALYEIRARLQPYKIIVLQGAGTERPNLEHLKQRIEEAWNQKANEASPHRLLIQQTTEQEDILEVRFSIGDQSYSLIFSSKSLPWKRIPQRLLFSTEIPDLILREGMQEHGAYWELSLQQRLGRSAKLSLSAAMVLIAKLIDANSLLIWSAHEGSVNPLSEENRKLLSSANACDLVKKVRYNPDFVVSFESVEKAKAKAQDTFSQFASAFRELEDKDYEGNFFYVRFELVDSEDGRSEHIWVAVDSIHGDEIVGAICNDPMTATTYKNGQTVSLSTKQVEDWIYSDGDKMNGGYSVVSPFG